MTIKKLLYTPILLGIITLLSTISVSAALPTVESHYYTNNNLLEHEQSVV